jgi:DNA-binding CsgD family transcriptional regulator
MGGASHRASHVPTGKTTQPATHRLLSAEMGEDVDGALRVIGSLSILGDRFDVHVAAQVSGIAPADLLQALEIAEREGQIVVEGGFVRFTAGRRDQAYRSLGLHGQAKAHARAAEVLDHVHPRDLPSIAEQRAGAVAILGLDAALVGFEDAADAAERALDWEQAARLWKRAAEVAAAGHDSRANLFALRRARCLFRAGIFSQAVTICRQVASEARAAGDGRLLADASLVVRGIGDRDTCAVLLDLCRDALRGVYDDVVLRSRLQSQVIMLSSEQSPVPMDGTEALENVRVAEESGDAQALVEALHALQMVSAGPRNATRRLAITDRVERLCHEADLIEYLAWPLGWRIDVLFQLGQRPALDNAIERLEEYADRRNDALATWRARMARATLAQHEGRFEDAIRLGGQAQELGARGNHRGSEFLYRILVSMCHVKTGGPIETSVGGAQPGPEAFHAFTAMLAAQSGDLETAAALFPLVLPALDELDGSDPQVPTHVAFATVAWALNRADAAPLIYTVLEPFAEELANSASGQSASMGSVSRYLGQMATLMGDWDRTDVDFARALRRNIETGARAEVAETRFDWAAALLRHGLTPDRERAGAMLEAAARDASELGMEPLRRRAVDALAALKQGRSPITARELEVADLVAAGLSNKEVANELNISVRTAENHLLSAMSKLGMVNRAQVATWVTRTRATAEARALISADPVDGVER